MSNNKIGRVTKHKATTKHDEQQKNRRNIETQRAMKHREE